MWEGHPKQFQCKERVPKKVCDGKLLRKTENKRMTKNGRERLEYKGSLKKKNTGSNTCPHQNLC